MTVFLSLLGIVAAFFMLKYRERLGDMVGEAPWMDKIGGVHVVITVLAVLIFFWCIAALTGTTDLFFRPLLFLFPGARSSGGSQDFIID